jgi:hypothetical protein
MPQLFVDDLLLLLRKDIAGFDKRIAFDGDLK